MDSIRNFKAQTSKGKKTDPKERKIKTVKRVTVRHVTVTRFGIFPLFYFFYKYDIITLLQKRKARERNR